MSDILLANLTTTSDNSLLETGGMIHIAAISNNENCKIKDGQKIEISFPTKAKKDDMQIFKGDWDNNRINWQAVSNSADLNKIYTVADIQPQFPGGDQKMMQFVSKSIKYPNKAKELGIQGTVHIRFTIDRDGNVKDATVLRGIEPECDREALNAVLQFPKFKPAQSNGENVNIIYNLPVRFTLDGVTKSADVKQNFEKNYNDTTINTAYSSHITSYLFSTTELGWINCDRFINERGEKIDLLVKLDKKAESDVKIVFHRIKSIMSSFPTNDKHAFTKIPKGEKITIVAIKNIDNKPHLAIKETVTSTQTETDFTFQPITMESLKNEMKKLDRFN
jgi:TonB family protein